MENIYDLEKLEVGKTYTVTETFTAKFTGRFGNRFRFEENAAHYLFTTPEMFLIAQLASKSNEMWPPLPGEVWKDPEGARWFVREAALSDTSILCATKSGNAKYVSKTNPEGWKPVFTERFS